MNKKRRNIPQAALEADAAPLGSDESASAVSGNGYLAAWFFHDRADEFFGESFGLKMDVLACLIQRGNLAEVARRHGVTRAAASKQARRARALFGELATPS